MAKTVVGRQLKRKSITTTAQKAKFSIKEFFSKCDQICRKLRIWSHLLKKSLMKNFIFCVVYKNRKSYYKNGGSYKKGNNFEKSKSKLGTNPVDSDGIIMRCHNCDSTKHFESNCPH